MTDPVQWQVGLSDGTTAHEGKNEYKVVEGELSPWRKLIAYTKEKDVTITSLSLCCGKKRWNLPSAGKNPKFRDYDMAEKPTEYTFFRKLGADIVGGDADVETYAVIEATYSCGKLQIWVSEKNPDNCWSVLL